METGFLMAWTDGPPKAEFLLRDLADALVRSKFLVEQDWGHVLVQDRKNLAVTESKNSIYPPKEFWKMRTKEAPLQTCAFSVGTRFLTEPNVPCEVEAFDIAICNQSVGLDTIRHPAAVVSFPESSFVFPSELIDVVAPNPKKVEQYSHRIDELVVALRELVRATKPSAAYLVSRNYGYAYPYNSYLAYYVNAEEVIRDIRWLESLWDKPVQSSKGEELCPSLRMIPATDSYVFSDQRTDSQREKLKLALDERFPLKCEITETHVKSVLSDKSTDVFRNWSSENASDFAVCFYPAILNNLIDSFYIRVIDAALADVSSCHRT